ncbi:hypothetical protein G3A56_15950 [Rhizobium oryzihabitans]|uniref:Uncharacterized protein n=1 Tax=Rhizobium oryzihabitans TaxID=2267833 RepID=A0A7L5BKA7_9HYPH|nr:hypothetical protein [Rhizobium oryzihabitans]QIB39309.1 hypothetical protein G3A56_15950 [Rhizobium oryzihabitans]
MADTVKHTRVPWGVEGKGLKLLIGPKRLSDGKVSPVVASVDIHPDHTSETKRKIEADVLLIAAAPDLLGALKDIEAAALQGFLTPNYCADIVIAAIAKAEGRS